MERKEIIIEPPLNINGMKLIPVVEVSLNSWSDKAGIAFFGVRRPASVVLVSSTAKRAFRVTGEEISLAQLMREVPAIKEMLEEKSG